MRLLATGRRQRLIDNYRRQPGGRGRGSHTRFRADDSQRSPRCYPHLPQRQPVQLTAASQLRSGVGQIVDGHDRLDKAVAEKLPHHRLYLPARSGAHYAHPHTGDEQTHHRIDQLSPGCLVAVVFDSSQCGIGVEDHRTQYISVGR